MDHIWSMEFNYKEKGNMYVVQLESTYWLMEKKTQKLMMFMIECLEFTLTKIDQCFNDHINEVNFFWGFGDTIENEHNIFWMMKCWILLLNIVIYDSKSTCIYAYFNTKLNHFIHQMKF
jgi:hypothetical protein